MKRSRHIIALLLALLMTVTMLPTAAMAAVDTPAAQQAGAEPAAPVTADGTEAPDDALFDGASIADRIHAIQDNFPEQAEETEAEANGVTVTKIENPDLSVKDLIAEAEEKPEELYAPDEPVRVIVALEDESLLEQGYTKEEISSGSEEIAREVAAMEAQQDAVVEDIQAIVDVMSAGVSTFSLDDAPAASVEPMEVEVRYHYSVALNGVAVSVPYGTLEAITKLDGVKAAFVVPTYDLPTDMSGELSINASPAVYATQNGFGTARTWDVGYTGAGMRIAIIDSGLDWDHPSFAAAPKAPSLNETEISGVLDSLNAYEAYQKVNSGRTLTVDNVYYSEKVPYGFNYVDASLDVTHDKDNQGDHGTHVAGIAAANRVEGCEVAGVAPDAQILVMKVFGQNGGAYADDIAAALEDCIRLNVDAVNMSLGSPAGFTESGYDFIDEIYAQIEKCDMVVAISAGNSGSAAAGNGWGNDRNLTSDPDNSAVSSPATYAGSTVVASIENESVMCNYIEAGGTKLPYSDVAAISLSETLAAEARRSYTYVMVPGYGSTDDFAQVNVSGKIAVVSRGELAFTDKQTNAFNAGAVACIVYDNVDGDLINMQDAEMLPNVFISKDSGAVLAANTDENGEGTLIVAPADDKMITPSSLAGLLSDFSSWGVSPNLELTPDVTAPGGNIYSTLNNGKYGTMSGTSMASPHIAGMSALVLEYLHESYPDHDDSWYHTAAEALIMSTAEPVVEPTGELYSPRKQGSGYANVYDAVTSPAYLTVDDSEGDPSTPKASLGDDPSKTGVYTFSFDINNLSSSPVSYVLSGAALTDQVDQPAEDMELYFMGETSRSLDAQVVFSVGGVEIGDSISSAVGDLPYDADEDGDVDLDDVQYMLDSVNGLKPALPELFDINEDGKQDTADAQRLYELLLALPAAGDGVVNVPANGSVEVTVTITLSDADKAYMDKYYPNGIFVDGFVRCYAVGGTIDLSLPFLAFYGDWSDARIFDDSWYWGSDESGVPNRYYNIFWTNYGSSDSILGMNPYVDEPHEDGHNVLSPNGDGYQDYVNEIYLGMMRNAKHLEISWKQNADEKELFSITLDNVNKSYYYAAYDMIIPFVYSWYIEKEEQMLPDFSDLYEDEALEDGDTLTLTVTGYLDDGDDVADETISVPVVIDNTAPEINDVELIYDEETDKRTLLITVSDNYDAAALITTTETWDIIDALPVDGTGEGSADGETAVIELDVSDYDASFILAICDYGCNESYYSISFSGRYNVDFDSFYAYRRYCVVPYGNYLIPTDGYNGWHSFEAPDRLLMHTSMYNRPETAVAAAEFVDGYVIGVDVNSTIFAMKSGDWDRTVIGTLELNGQVYPALDMAFDYTTDTLYILTDELSSGYGGHLVKMNYLTGKLEDLGTIDMRYGSQPLTLACDNDGTLYTVNFSEWAAHGYESGFLYTIDKDTLKTTMVGDTGYRPNYHQSMTVDHATNTLYWAAYQGATGTSVLYEVDKETAELTPFTDADGNVYEGVEFNSELTALFKPYLSGKALYPTEAEELALTGLVLSETGMTMAAGNEKQLISRPLPYYAETSGEVVWTTSDEKVVTVNEYGVVTAVGEGTATITATLDGKSASCEVRVVEINADLYVYDAGSDYMWLSFNAAEPQYADYVYDARQPNGSYDAFVSAAYVEGSIYAFDTAGGFYKLDAETLDGVRLGTNSNVNGSSGFMTALAFNYADGYLYGIAQIGDYFEMESHLVRVNPANGDFVTLYTFDADYQLMNLAVDPDGTFYSIVDVYDYDTNEAVTKILTFRLGDEEDPVVFTAETVLQGFETGYGNYNSLVYSYENDGLFWADYYGRLLWIDPDTGENIVLGDIGSTAYYYPMNVCLVEIPEEECEAKFANPETVTMPTSFLLLEGGTTSAGVVVAPWNARATLTYSVDNSEVATVDEAGTITGVSAGTTTLTVNIAEMYANLTADITVVKSAGALYGNIVTDFLYGSNYWVDIPDTDPGNAEILYDSYDDDFQVYSGAYYDGSVYGYAQDQWGDLNYKYYLLKVDAESYGDYEIIAQIHATIRDMDFDYTTGVMYAIVEDGEAAGALAQVNLETGALYIVGDTGHTMAAMTVDGNGTIYAIGEDANLYSIDKNTAEATLVGATGVANVSLFQSMHYDAASGNTYWAQAARDYSNGLYLVDLHSGAATSLGTVGTGAEVGCLYTVPETKPSVPETTAPTGVSLNEKATVAAGETVSLNAAVLPFSVASVDQTLTWSSSNEAVATVENGVVTGVTAGTAVITAATTNGKSASCLVTVTAEARRFYAYDESNARWISFSAEDTTDVNVERADNEDDAPIMASVYVDGQLYAYTVDGSYYSVNPTSFERTYVGKGVSEMTVEVTVFDWWGGSYTLEEPVTPYDLSYDEATGKTFGLFMVEDYENWAFEAVIGEVDLETGVVTPVYQSGEIQPGNLLVKNGRAYFIDTYYTGMLTYLDLYADEPTPVQHALVYGYWGDFTDGRSLLEDPLTGTIYTIRDNSGSASSLWTITLGDADVQSIGLIGEGIIANSLFIK